MAVLDQDGGASRDPIHDPNQAFSIQEKRHAISRSNTELVGRALTGRDERVRVGRVTEEACGDGLEARMLAVRPIPEQQLDEVDQLVFEDALEGFESISAPNARDGDGPLDIMERVEEQHGGHGDLVHHLDVARRRLASLARCLPSGRGHPFRDSEAECAVACTDEAGALTAEEGLVVQVKKVLEIVAVNGGEVARANVRRVFQRGVVDRVGPGCNLLGSKPDVLDQVLHAAGVVCVAGAWAHGVWDSRGMVQATCEKPTAQRVTGERAGTCALLWPREPPGNVLEGRFQMIDGPLHPSPIVAREFELGAAEAAATGLARLDMVAPQFDFAPTVRAGHLESEWHGSYSSFGLQFAPC